MERLLARLHLQLQQQLPFALYSKPGSATVTGIFQKSNKLYTTKNFAEEGFVFAPFARGTVVFIPAAVSDIFSSEIEPRIVAAGTANTDLHDEKAKAAFEALVSKSVNAIKEGKFDKLVVSRKEMAELPDMDITKIFERLLNAYPNAFRYCFYSPQTGLWMGATPEQLLKAKDGSLHTVALAGTQVFKEGEEAVWGEKEKQEQRFVTDYIVQSLNSHATDFEITEPYTYRAGNIVHIKTDITAKIKEGSDLNEVIMALHPTPAVCGLLKEDAKAFLLENEGYDREYYSGFLGEVNMAGRTDLFVNLRCMKINKGVAELFIGCGITKDSDPEKEFTETVNKSMTMKRIL